MTPEQITIVAGLASVALVTVGVGCLAVSLWLLWRKDQEMWAWMFYACLFGIFSAIAVPYETPGHPTVSLALSKWAAVLVCGALALFARSRRPRHPGTPGRGSRGALMVFPLPMLFLLPIHCGSWWAGFGGGLGFLLIGGFTLDPVMAIGGALSMISAGDIPRGC